MDIETVGVDVADVLDNPKLSVAKYGGRKYRTMKLVNLDGEVIVVDYKVGRVDKNLSTNQSTKPDELTPGERVILKKVKSVQGGFEWWQFHTFNENDEDLLKNAELLEKIERENEKTKGQVTNPLEEAKKRLENTELGNVDIDSSLRYAEKYLELFTSVYELVEAKTKAEFVMDEDGNHILDEVGYPLKKGFDFTKQDRLNLTKDIIRKLDTKGLGI